MVGPHDASRQQLEALRDSLLADIASWGGAAYDSAGAFRLGVVERRLREGDFDVGDVVDLVTSEEKWTGQFTVQPDRTLDLPDIPPISLYGVLYSEGEEALRSDLSRYLRDPQVRMRTTKRIAVLGEVGAPGFYDVEGSMLVSQALMLAGGVASTARVNKMQLQRGGKKLFTVDQEAAQLMTLDDLGVQSGDHFFLPSATGTNIVLRNILMVSGMITGLLFLIF